MSSILLSDAALEGKKCVESRLVTKKEGLGTFFAPGKNFPS
jgi:hypothetical protein